MPSSLAKRGLVVNDDMTEEWSNNRKITEDWNPKFFETCKYNIKYEIVARNGKSSKADCGIVTLKDKCLSLNLCCYGW